MTKKTINTILIKAAVNLIMDDTHYIIDKHKPLVFQNQRQTTVIPINQSSVTIPLDKFF